MKKRSGPPAMLHEKKPGVSSAVVVIVCALLFALLFLDLRFTRDFFAVEVSGSSMESTLSNGDMLYADRTAAPARGDIVIIDVSAYRLDYEFSGNFIIKRVIAVAGDTVRIADGAVYLKKSGETEFSRLEESYAKSPTESVHKGEIAVGEGQIFFLGDNRPNSLDSRIVGCLPASQVVGVVPGWALKFKEQIAGWERYRAHLA